MKIFNSNDAFDRKQVILDSVGQSFFDINNMIGLILNILVPIVLLFIVKVDITTFFFSFIAFDIFLIILENLVLFFSKSFNSIIWIFQKIGYKKKISNMSHDEMLSYKEKFDVMTSFYDEKIKILDDMINEYRSLETITTPKAKQNELVFVEEMIEKFDSYKGVDFIEEKMKELVSVSKKLLELIKDDINSISIVINTYNIYSEELLKIVSSYEEMSSEQKSKYSERLQYLFDAFLNHLKRQEVKITEYKENSIDFDIDFLIQKLNEEESKNV